MGASEGENEGLEVSLPGKLILTYVLRNLQCSIWQLIVNKLH